MKRLLILSSKPNGPSTQRFATGIQQAYGDDITVTVSTYSMLTYEIIGGTVHITERATGLDLAAFNAVYFKSYMAFAELAGVAADYLTSVDVPFVDTEVDTYHITTKLTQYVKLALAGLPVPDSVYVDHTVLAESYDTIVQKVGTPFVLKDIAAEQGNYNHLIHARQELIATQQARHDTPMYIAQRYIKAANDVRALVFGDQLAFAIRRTATAKDTHLHNTSKGGLLEEIEPATFDPHLKALSVQSAQLLNRQVAGVDFIFDALTDTWYILEVNNSPQFSKQYKIEAFANYLKELMHP